MKVPQIELLPLRAAVSSDRSSTLDVLVRIVPPTTSEDLKRPALNLGFILDRSGSMSEQKMEFARQAAGFGVPNSEDMLAETLPLEEVQAWKAYLGLPKFSSARNRTMLD